MIKPRSGIRKVAGEEVSFPSGQNGSLRIWCVERSYRIATSDSDVSANWILYRPIERPPIGRIDECALPAREVRIRQPHLEFHRRAGPPPHECPWRKERELP